ncbi:anthranilate synthase component I family protein [Paenibacillus humicola]|uniref:anthranilate synthase component I family protein n=1 Tax=Paenibacillus humicola TaxID=3110540 RepID=UPI00237BAF83|nr:anthranilate synthase component I family protein [Paenibacillus humicola]
MGLVREGMERGLEAIVSTAFADWVLWHNEGYTSLPLLLERPLPPERLRPASWEPAWRSADSHAIVLESGKDGRYTYLGIGPSSVIRGKGGRAEAWDRDDRSGRSETKTRYEGGPLETVRTWMEGRRAPRLWWGPKWTGGCAGFWSYDIVRSIERLPETAADDLGLPDYLFMRFDELWVIDRIGEVLFCAVHTEVVPGMTEHHLRSLYEDAIGRAEAMLRQWEEWTSGGAGEEAADRCRMRTERLEKESLHIDIEAVEGITSPFPKTAYMEAVQRIRDYIAQGDVFQVNLSLRQSRRLAARPEELYEWLRLINPSPYMGFLRCPDFQLVSASPELLVELRDGRLATRPIAGTRRRGRTEEEDRRMAEELRTSEKERAEHIMLVDLERNDLGRIAAYGSVRVKELMAIEYYSHVMHLVSQVEGLLAEGKDAFDVIAATFPGGTITGAPKVRTMEIIEELEPVRRGPYTGSLGWIDYGGDMEFNIIIRTMTVKDGVVHTQAGAGIVIDSVPEREYYESLNKAKALWKAIEYSERSAEHIPRG